MRQSRFCRSPVSAASTEVSPIVAAILRSADRSPELRLGNSRFSGQRVHYEEALSHFKATSIFLANDFFYHVISV